MHILQQSKNIHFDNEDGWDITFKTYDELVDAYKIQDSLPMDVVLEAIENTNRLADRVEEFSLDKSYRQIPAAIPPALSLRHILL